MATFVQAVFSEETRNTFKQILEQIAKPEDLYHSPDPKGAHIQGDMTDKLHMTIYYGLPREAKFNDDLRVAIKENYVDDLKLGEFYFIPGFQDLYKVLCIRVKDEDGKLKDFCEAVSYFAWEDRYTERFDPHLTLAYVTNEYELPANLPNIPEEIEVDNIIVSERL